ncbi:hypothetical protein [Amycolatopsis benzoatilytica]|uniref:hypothetical protein n=1 Tax=Amycolatopsis benzoatilytica TaxID=346045 RepID=UPI000379BCED|nr:hypothetical protein [Amycolatopsis benzoatilytica]
MTRFVTKAAVAALVALPVLAPVASAQTAGPQAVDEKSGPVSFANVASARLGGGALITETQRSPLTPGQSQLGTDRTMVPKNAGERGTFGPNYEIDLGKYDKDSPYPEGIASRDHKVIAALQATNVPTAVAETNYAVRDLSRGKAGVEDTMLVVEGGHSEVACTGPGKITSATTAARIWVRGEDDQLKQVPMPASGSLSVTGLKMTSPTDVQGASRDKTTSDLVLSRVSSFDQLIKQDGWRSGDITAQAGWRVEITTHARDANGASLNNDVHTSIVLGGVSCSIPKNFVALSGNGTGTGGGTGTVQQPSVPTQVPAGYLGASAAAPADDFRLPLGFGLLGGGLVFGALAVALGRRRAARVAVRSHSE